MPIRREFRAFGEAGKVLCIHPYWPPEALDETVAAMPEYQAMNRLNNDVEAVEDLVARASECVEGEWSIDCLWTARDWRVTSGGLIHVVSNRFWH